MPKKSTSPLWNYFDKLPNKRAAICRICHNSYSFSSTTGNLKSHIKSRHPELLPHLTRARKEAKSEGIVSHIYVYTVYMYAR